MEVRITLAILAILVLWTVSAIVYAWKNDFAKETHSILLPVLGTALLSFFIAAKFIWVDAPRNPQSVSGTIVILHNAKKNYFVGMGLSESKMDVKHMNRNGLINFNNEVVQRFHDLNIPQQLQESEQGEKRTAVLLDCLEYSIFLWLKDLHDIKNSWLNFEQKYSFPTGYSEDAKPMTQQRMVKTIEVNRLSFPENDLFTASPVKINMPTGATVKSVKKKNEFCREFEIITDHSKIRFTLQQLSAGPLEINATTLPSSVKSYILNYGESFWSNNFSFEISQEINKLNCYSMEGKLHPVWYQNLSAKFAEAFSWEAFRKVYN